jgi:hypothetical protein
MTINRAAASEVSIHLGQHRPRLVLDPWLCLDADGPLLIQRLQGFAELWIVRELWHILDDSHYYSAHPGALVSERGPRVREYQALFAGAPESTVLADSRALSADGERDRDLADALLFWDRARLATDLAGLRLFWMGDGLAESLLPEGTPASAHERHERLVRWLDERLAPRSPVACAQRDALALSLSLGGVPVLSVLDRDGEAFSLSGWLSSCRVRCAELPIDDRWLGLERDRWTSLLVRANCAPLFWNGLRLAVVHLCSSEQVMLPLAAITGDEADEVPIEHLARSEQVNAFWYAL